MGPMYEFLQRYLAPFVTGVCMAGATVVHEVPVVVVLVLAGGMSGFLSFPAGARMIQRLSGVSSQA
jgi:hypothetical protein